MQEFLAAILAFPTVFFTALMGLVLLYWMTVILGAFDIDALDSALGLDGMDSALDGALEALDGAADGALDGALEAIEGATDGAADGALEALDGSLDGAAESLDGAAEGAADAADGIEGAKQGALSGLLNVLGVRGVPITVVGSFIILWAWILSFLGNRYLGAAAAGAVVGSGVGIASFIAALVLGGISVRPFSGLFVTHTAQARASLVGKLCTVTSSRVDSEFGIAEIDDGGAGVVAEVRCPKKNDLKRGATALVFGYERASGVYLIGPMDEAFLEASKITED